MGTLRLRIELFLRRQGYWNVLSYAIGLAALLAWIIIIPHRNNAAQLAKIQLENARLPTSQNAELSPLTQHERLEAFQRILGQPGETEAAIGRMFSLAKANGIDLPKGDYKSELNRTGQYDVYEITLPVQGEYLPIRRFCEEILKSITYSSIDAIQFSRQGADTSSLDAKIVVSLYLATDAHSSHASSTTSVVAGLKP